MLRVSCRTLPPPVGSREVLFIDPGFVDMPAWSHALMPGSDVVYLQATAENLGYDVRVTPQLGRGDETRGARGQPAGGIVGDRAFP